MIRVLLGASVLGSWLLLRSRKTNSNLLSGKTVAAGFGSNTQLARVHGQLMHREFHPKRLEQAARRFGAEGLNDQARELIGKAKQIRKQAAVIPGLVERARAGDQNALGMITEVRENADAGLARAAVTCKLVEQYCIKNPPAPQPGDETLAGDAPE